MKLEVGLPNISSYKKVDKFCCCLSSLKSGAIFIGVLYTTLSLLSVSAIFSYVPSFDKTSGAFYGEEGYELGQYGIYTLINLVKITTIIWLLVNLSLLYGAMNDRVNFVTPWVGWHLVMFFLQLIGTIWIGNIVTDVMITHVMEVTALVFAELIMTGLGIYFCIIVNNYQVQLVENDKTVCRKLQEVVINRQRTDTQLNLYPSDNEPRKRNLASSFSRERRRISIPDRVDNYTPENHIYDEPTDTNRGNGSRGTPEVLPERRPIRTQEMVSQRGTARTPEVAQQRDYPHQSTVISERPPARPPKSVPEKDFKHSPIQYCEPADFHGHWNGRNANVEPNEYQPAIYSNEP